MEQVLGSGLIKTADYLNSIGKSQQSAELKKYAGSMQASLDKQRFPDGLSPYSTSKTTIKTNTEWGWWAMPKTFSALASTAWDQLLYLFKNYPFTNPFRLFMPSTYKIDDVAVSWVKGASIISSEDTQKKSDQAQQGNVNKPTVTTTAPQVSRETDLTSNSFLGEASGAGWHAIWYDLNKPITVKNGDKFTVKSNCKEFYLATADDIQNSIPGIRLNIENGIATYTGLQPVTIKRVSAEFRNVVGAYIESVVYKPAASAAGQTVTAPVSQPAGKTYNFTTSSYFAGGGWKTASFSLGSPISVKPGDVVTIQFTGSNGLKKVGVNLVEQGRSNGELGIYSKVVTLGADKKGSATFTISGSRAAFVVIDLAVGEGFFGATINSANDGYIINNSITVSVKPAGAIQNSLWLLMFLMPGLFKLMASGKKNETGIETPGGINELEFFGLGSLISSEAANIVATLKKHQGLSALLAAFMCLAVISGCQKEDLSGGAGNGASSGQSAYEQMLSQAQKDYDEAHAEYINNPTDIGAQMGVGEREYILDVIKNSANSASIIDPNKSYIENVVLVIEYNYSTLGPRSPDDYNNDQIQDSTLIGANAINDTAANAILPLVRNLENITVPDTAKTNSPQNNIPAVKDTSFSPTDTLVFNIYSIKLMLSDTSISQGTRDRLMAQYSNALKKLEELTGKEYTRKIFVTVNNSVNNLTNQASNKTALLSQNNNGENLKATLPGSRVFGNFFGRNAVTDAIDELFIAPIKELGRFSKLLALYSTDRIHYERAVMNFYIEHGYAENLENVLSSTRKRTSNEFKIFYLFSAEMREIMVKASNSQFQKLSLIWGHFLYNRFRSENELPMTLGTEQPEPVVKVKAFSRTSSMADQLVQLTALEREAIIRHIEVITENMEGPERDAALREILDTELHRSQLKGVKADDGIKRAVLSASGDFVLLTKYASLGRKEAIDRLAELRRWAELENAAEHS